MGIAKSILRVTVFDGYTSDIDRFIQLLVEKLDANFIVTVYDYDFNLLQEESKLYSFSKSNTFKLCVEHEEFFINGSNCLMPQYRLTIPAPYYYGWQTEIDFDFYPNHGVQVSFLTFEHMWGEFIRILKFEENSTIRNLAFKRYNYLRNEYCKILHKLDILELLIITHAHYVVEDIYDEQYFYKACFLDILQLANKEDNLTAFSFNELLEVNNVNEVPYDFKLWPDMQIALIDTIFKK